MTIDWLHELIDQRTRERDDRQRMLDDVKRMADEVMMGIQHRPAMWGSPLANELQFLLALEFKLLAADKYPGFVQSEWQAFCNDRLHDVVTHPMSERVSPEELRCAMRDFVAGPFEAMLELR